MRSWELLAAAVGVGLVAGGACGDGTTGAGGATTMASSSGATTNSTSSASSSATSSTSAGGGGATSSSTGGAGGAGGSGGAGGQLPSGQLQWAENFGLTNAVVATSVAIDPQNGDVVAAGYFDGTVDFGAGVLASDPNPQKGNIFVARFDSQGKTKWAKSFGGSTDCEAYGVGVGASGTVFVGGVVAAGSLDFGCGTLTQIGDEDAVLVALGASGDCLWSKRFGVGGQVADVISLHVDKQENVIVGGLAWGGLDLGGGQLPYDGIYVAKFSKTGAHLWSKSFQGFQSGLVLPRTVVDPSGNVILAGGFGGTANFGGATLSTGGPGTKPDAFVAKLDPAGKHLWSKQYGDSENQQAQFVAVDAKGEIAVVGGFAGTIDFGAGPLTEDLNAQNVFLAKLDGSGNAIWSEDVKAPLLTSLNLFALAADSAGGVEIGLGFSDAAQVGAGTIDFGGGKLTSQSDGLTSVAVASFDAAGKYRWAFGGGPPSVNRYSGVGAYGGIAASASRVVIAGHFGWNKAATSPAGTTLVLPGKTLTAVSGSDMFLASFTP